MIKVIACSVLATKSLSPVSLELGTPAFASLWNSEKTLLRKQHSCNTCSMDKELLESP